MKLKWLGVNKNLWIYWRFIRFLWENCRISRIFISEGFILYFQVISVCQAGTMIVWMIDTGQKVKQFNNTHANSEVTCLAQDPTETKLFTGSTDGTVKVRGQGQGQTSEKLCINATLELRFDFILSSACYTLLDTCTCSSYSIALASYLI